MKKFFLISFICFFVTLLPCNAIPAKPGLIRTLTLQDGTTVKAQLVGDEHGHYWLAQNGRAYQKEEGTAYFIEVDTTAIQSMANARRALRRKVCYASTSDGLGRYNTPGLGALNSIGEYTIPVIMVQFFDKEFKSTTTVEKMTRFYNEQGYHDESGCVGSVRDYFVSQSRGMFKPTFDVVGIVTLNNSYSYYGAGTESISKVNQLVKDAVAAAVSNLGANFAQYIRTTTNSNGTTTGVPLVCILYAGYGEATGHWVYNESTGNWEEDDTENTVWPCEVDCNMTMSGTKFNSYFVGNELYYDDTLMGMGVFCHEAGHALGLPDFYCTDYSYSKDDPFSNWSIMDCGAYVNDARAPIGYTAYERSYLGWLDIPTYTAGEYQNLDPYTNTNGTTAVKVATSSSTEYFILENRQPGTWYPEDMGSGLLVSRFAYNQTAWDNNTLNNTKNKKRAKIVAADGAALYYSGDQANLYGNGVNSITSLTRYSSGTVNPQISTITKNSDGTITLNVEAGTNVATPTFSPKAGRYSEAQSVTISCATEGATIYYTTDGTTPTSSSILYTAPVTISETTTLKAIVIADGEESNVATAKYVIGASTSNPDTKNFKLVASTDELEPGMRYIIACGSKNVAAGERSSTSSASYLAPVTISLSNDIITITDDVAVFVLEGSGNEYSFLNEETGEYLYATAAKNVTYSSDEKEWTLANYSSSVTMTYGSYGTMLYNVGSPRFTTYISSPNTSMILANLYMEYSDEIPIVKQDVTMAFSASSAVATLGQTFTPPALTTTPLGLAVTYSSSDTDVATVDESGSVTLVAKGTTTITATFAGNDYYNPGSATYTLTVQGPTTATNRYELVTDASTLAVGDSILLVYATDPYRRIMSTTTNDDKYRTAGEFVFNDDNTITPSANDAIVVLGGSRGAWTFFVSNGNETGYLSASSSSSNNMKTVQTIDKNAQATISISSGSATITFQGSYTRNLLKYNTSYLRFSCYQSSSTGTQYPQIYRQVKVEIEDVPGDVNKDGVVTVADVTALVNILLGQDADQTLYNHEAADVDGQKGVTTDDISALINLVLQQ